MDGLFRILLFLLRIDWLQLSFRVLSYLYFTLLILFEILFRLTLFIFLRSLTLIIYLVWILLNWVILSKLWFLLLLGCCRTILLFPWITLINRIIWFIDHSYYEVFLLCLLLTSDKPFYTILSGRLFSLFLLSLIYLRSIRSNPW